MDFAGLRVLSFKVHLNGLSLFAYCGWASNESAAADIPYSCPRSFPRRRLPFKYPGAEVRS